MATAAEKKQAYEQWKEHCKRVQSITDTALLAGETPAQRTGAFCGCRVTMPHSANITFPTSSPCVTRPPGSHTHHSQCTVPQCGSGQSKGYAQPEGGIHVAARSCQVHSHGHLRPIMAHVPTQAAHQFHGGGRQKRRLCHTSAGRYSGGTGTQPAHHCRLRQAAGECLLAGWGVQGCQRG